MPLHLKLSLNPFQEKITRNLLLWDLIHAGESYTFLFFNNNLQKREFGLLGCLWFAKTFKVNLSSQ